MSTQKLGGFIFANQDNGIRYLGLIDSDVGADYALRKKICKLSGWQLRGYMYVTQLRGKFEGFNNYSRDEGGLLSFPGTPCLVTLENGKVVSAVAEDYPRNMDSYAA